MRNRNFLKEAGITLTSLLSEGYTLRYCAEPMRGSWQAMLVHRNGNYMHITATIKGYTLFKNGKLIKKVG